MLMTKLRILHLFSLSFSYSMNYEIDKLSRTTINPHYKSPKHKALAKLSQNLKKQKYSIHYNMKLMSNQLINKCVRGH